MAYKKPWTIQSLASRLVDLENRVIVLERDKRPKSVPGLYVDHL